MASKGCSNLNKNERGLSTNFFGNFAMYKERDWVKGTNTIREYFDIQPTNTNASRGSIITIEIDKRGDRLGKSTLVFTRAAITGGIPVERDLCLLTESPSIMLTNLFMKSLEKFL